MKKLLLLFVIVIFAGCASVESKYAGDWKVNNEVLNIKKTGKKYFVGNEKKIIEGKAKKGNLLLDMPSGEKATLMYVNQDKLSLKFGGGKTVEFERVVLDSVK